jgi:hypothetical protein
MSYPPWTTFHCFKSEGNSFFTFASKSHLDVFLGMQIGQRVSFQLIAKASLVHKPHGQIGGIMVTARSHQNLWPRCSSLY